MLTTPQKISKQCMISMIRIRNFSCGTCASVIAYPSKYSQREAKHTEASTWTPLSTPYYDLENLESTRLEQAKMDKNARFSHMKAFYDLLQGTGLVRIISLSF